MTGEHSSSVSTFMISNHAATGHGCYIHLRSKQILDDKRFQSSLLTSPGAAATMNNKTDPLADFSLKAYFDQINVNNASVLVSLQQAISGFRSLSDSSASKTFIFTGNVLNLVTSPRMMTFGLSKNATAYAIRTLVEGKVYEGEGIS